MIGIAALVVGIVLGLVFHPSVPEVVLPYLPIAVVAALDAVFGGLRAYLDRIPDDKIRQYQPTWTDEQVMEWCGDFRDDGALFITCSERDVDVGEFRRALDRAIAYRDRVRPTLTQAPNS